jgi:hypothetical protein
MSHILIGLFDSGARAHFVRQELLTNGIDHGDISLSATSPPGNPPDTRARHVRDAVEHSNSVQDVVGDLLRALFVKPRQPLPERAPSADPTRRGPVKVEVRTRSLQEAQFVGDLMRHDGAWRVDARFESPPH